VDVKLVLKTAAFLLAVTGVGAAARIPSGAQIQIRLSTEINTSAAKVGDAFRALVIAPVVVEGRVAMAAGATLSGHVKEATAAVNPDDLAVLALAFDEIRDTSGTKASIAAKLSAVDDARPTGGFRALSPPRRGQAGWIRGSTKFPKSTPRSRNCWET
jgi:hypothetical protein